MIPDLACPVKARNRQNFPLPTPRSWNPPACVSSSGRAPVSGALGRLPCQHRNGARQSVAWSYSPHYPQQAHCQPTLVRSTWLVSPRPSRWLGGPFAVRRPLRRPSHVGRNWHQAPKTSSNRPKKQAGPAPAARTHTSTRALKTLLSEARCECSEERTDPLHNRLNRYPAML